MKVRKEKTEHFRADSSNTAINIECELRYFSSTGFKNVSNYNCAGISIYPNEPKMNPNGSKHDDKINLNNSTRFSLLIGFVFHGNP